MMKQKITSHRPSIIPIKSVLARVTHDINMNTITIAIRNYCLQEQQSSHRNFLLTFFLLCQKKLKKPNNQEWNRVIDRQLKRFVGLDKLQSLMNKHIGQYFIERLRSGEHDNKERELERELNEQLGELEISQDIKVKTKYFFKWTKYLQDKRLVKEMKNQQVEQLKQAKFFYTYTMKFNNFLRWKQHVRKMKSCNEKGQQIKKNAQNRLLSLCLQLIKEKIQIITIQTQIQKVVQQKVERNRMVKLMLRLKQNIDRQSVIKDSLKLQKGNLWVYRFYQYLTKNQQAMMNPLMVQSRRYYRESYEKQCLLACWRGLKIKTQETSLKMARIRYQLKSSSLKQLFRIQSFRKKLRNSKKMLKMQIKKNLVKRIQVNSCKTTKVLQQYDGNISHIRQTIKLKYKNILLKQLKMYRFCMLEGRNKQISLGNMKLKLVKKSIMSRLKVNKKEKQETTQKSHILTYSNVWKIFNKRISCLKQIQNNKKQIQHEMVSIYQRNLLKYCFKSFKSYKRIKTNQKQTLNNIFKQLSNRVISETFQSIVERSTLVKKLDNLMKKSEYIIQKMAFITILNKMISNKMKIKHFYDKKELKLKQKLFQMFLNNHKHMLSQRQNIKNVISYNYKKRFIHNIRQNLIFHEKTSKTHEIYKGIEKSNFMNILKQRQVQKERIYESYGHVLQLIRSTRLQQFLQTFEVIREQQQEQANKVYKIHKIRVKNVLKSSKKINELKKQNKKIKVQQNQQLQQRITMIKSKIQKRSIAIFFNLTDKKLNQKINTLRKHRIINHLHVISLFSKQKMMNKMLKMKKFKEFLDRLRIIAILHRNTEQLSQKHRIMAKQQAINNMTINCREQIEERQAKESRLREYLHHHRLQNSCKYFTSKFKTVNELKENSSILSNFIVKQKFSELVKCYLTVKSASIKELIAVRFYANHLKWRAFRSFKKEVDVIILKENKVRSQYYSKQSRQKSLDQVKKKSKLLQTIQRFNMSRVSRVIR